MRSAHAATDFAVPSPVTNADVTGPLTPPDIPPSLQRTEGPLRDFDLLSIGVVLVVVLVIHLVRRVSRGRGNGRT